MTPLPQESSFSGSNSGSRPYFDGPNKRALCADQKNGGGLHGQISGGQRGDAQTVITPISNNFVPIVTVRLL